MPADEFNPDGALPSTGAGAPSPASAAPAASFTLDDVVELFKDAEFNKLPGTDRHDVLDTVLAGAFQDARQAPDWNREAYQAFGQFAQVARDKADPTLWEKTKALPGKAVTAVGHMAKDIALALYHAGEIGLDTLQHAIQDRKPGDIGATSGQAFDAQLRQWDAAAGAKLDRLMTENAKPLDDAVSSLLQGVDNGDFFDDPEWFKTQQQQLEKAQRAYWQALNPSTTETSADGNTVTVRRPKTSWDWRLGEDAAAADNSLQAPDNAALLHSYVLTRNKDLRDQLRIRLTRTPDRIAADRDLENAGKSPGAAAFEKVHGPGSFAQLASAMDPVNLGTNLLMVGGAARGALLGFEGTAASTSTTFARQALKGTAQSAGIMGAFGAAGAIKEDPGASAGTIASSAGESALLGAGFHGAAMGIGTAARITLDAVARRKAARAQATAPAGSGSGSTAADMAGAKDSLDRHFAEAMGEAPAEVNGSAVVAPETPEAPAARPRLSADELRRRLDEETKQRAEKALQQQREGGATQRPLIPDSPLGDPDILDFLNEHPITLPRKGTTGKAGEYDWREQYDLPRYYRKFIVAREGTGTPIDVMAEEAYRQAMINAPTAAALMEKVREAMQKRTQYRVQLRSQERALKDAEARTVAYEKAEENADQKVDLDRVAPGDKFDLGTEKDITVKEVAYDEDGHLETVTVEDGRKFGVLTFDAQSKGALLVDEWKPRRRVKAEDDPFSRESETEAKGFTNLKPGSRTEQGFIQLPPQFKDALDHAAALIRQGITRFSQWAAAMIKRFGEGIRQYLQGVWAAARRTSQIGAINPGADPVPARPAAEVAYKDTGLNEQDLAAALESEWRSFWAAGKSFDKSNAQIASEWAQELADPEGGTVQYAATSWKRDQRGSLSDAVQFDVVHEGEGKTSTIDARTGEVLATADVAASGFKLPDVKRNLEGGFIQLPPQFKGALDHAAALIRQGITDFATWATAMVKRFGEGIRQYLQGVWMAATRTSEVGAINLGGPITKRVLDDITGHARIVAQKFSETPLFTDLRRTLNGWVGRRQASSLSIRSMMQEIERQVPDAMRREGITNWIQAAGDDATLAVRESGSSGKRRDGYRLARSLTPQEIVLAQKIRDYYDTALARAQAHGLVEHGLENYVNQVWQRPVSKGKADALQGFMGQLSRTFKFGKRRTFESFYEGEQAGFEPVTKDVSKLLGLYLNELNKVIATREMIANLTTGAASDGRPLAVPEGGAIPQDPTAPATTTLVLPGTKGTVTFKGNEHETRDYRTADHPALAKWKFVAADTGGQPVMILGRLALHPEAHGIIKNALGESAIRQWTREAPDSIPGHLLRLAVRGVDALQSQVKASMMSLSPFHIVQEGTHAVGHKVNPFSHIPTIDPTNPAHRDAMNHGLMLAGDRLGMQNFMDGFTPKGSWLEKIPWLGTWQKNVSEFTFEHYIPGLKIKTYDHILQRNRLRYDKELKAGTIKLDDIKYLSAKQTNAAYGHLNYKDMGRNPTFQHLLRMTLLAPDFLEARAKFTGQAIQGITQKLGREQLVAMATLAVVFYVAARVGNAALNNGDTKNDLEHLFAIQAGNRIYTMRSVPEDIYRLMHSPRKFVAGRVAPLIGTGALEGVFGVNYRGEKVDGADVLQDMASNAIPMSVRMVPGLDQLTKTQKNHPVSPWEQFMGAMGLQIGRNSPIVEAQKLAHEYMQASGEEDRGSYPVSKYQQLRYALEDQNWDKAADEIKTLLGPTGRRADLRTAFHNSLFHTWTKGKKMDEQWKATLMPEQREILQAAEERRKAVWERFVKMLPTQ